MGQITGNNKDFPTIKQVNDALSNVDRILDISEYFNELYDLNITDINTIDTELTNQHLLELIDKILEVKPTVLKGSVDKTSSLDANFSFETSDIVWSVCDIDNYKNQYKITFKIYLSAFSITYCFSFFTVINVEGNFYLKYAVFANDQIV